MTSSRRHRNRSRSPPHSRRDRSPSRGNPGRPNSPRDYRDRDDYDRYGYDSYSYNNGYDASNRHLEEASAQVGRVTGQNPNVTYNITNHYYDTAPPGNAPRDNRSRQGGNRGQGENRSQGGDHRGRSRQARRRESSQASQPPRGSMPPPPSRAPLHPRPSSHRVQSSHGERGGSSRDDGPKKIPDKLRDKCGACREGHDIRFCPYPNTDQGQTKSCPVCNNTKHAWFQCEHYDPDDYWQQFNTCWMDRRGLPSAVHDEHLHEVFRQKVRMGDQNLSVEDRVRALNIKSGPLTPEFVKRITPPKDGDEYVQQQLQEGRKLPWDLSKQELHAGLERADKLIEDPATTNMQFDRMLEKTRTSDRNVPRAYKLPYFRELHQKQRDADAATAQQNSDVYKLVGMNKTNLPDTGRASTIRTTASRTIPALMYRKAKGQDEMAVTCGNCGTEGHRPVDCPEACKQCGQSMEIHLGYDGHCQLGGCLCRDSPGHTRAECDRLCRFCLMNNKDSTTPIKDCRVHCPYHVSDIQDGLDHSQCVYEHQNCPSCHGRHWRQDCPAELRTLCLLQSCRKPKCPDHCESCGGFGFKTVWNSCPAEWRQAENTPMWSVLGLLVVKWHLHVHSSQWAREEVTVGDISKDAWSKLRCKTHNHHLVDADSLVKLRETAWNEAFDHMKRDRDGGLKKAEIVLALPECPHCFTSAFEGSPDANFEGRLPGVPTDFGSEFIGAFPNDAAIPSEAQPAPSLAIA